ncbi:exodeoxyribonuclease VII large subunit [Parvularcula dongshanensis]|uniref:Exodeoxyribonuclease 7 large subunit n=1 Tax=Parvularcula dongshanensis TaxID=1173995 RepID=A0A840I143_9PROT|nr:exodeoxyribonuclease VII large subunit [Parvularcula dongshanensis]MBB4658457.1 exodeoxyribonuclease VII large subunit [Parvularcula dongshanensis]
MSSTTPSNTPEYTVSQLSGALKRTIEDAYGYVRVRGELGRVTRAGSGHVYLDLKDERAVLSSVVWKGSASRMKVRPEQGMEVIATGRMTTFPGQSRYQLVIDTLEPAGAGTLMALFEERKKKLAAEGLFDPARKRPLPYLPSVIGVVTSPSGAVIRDILHRLRDRFPSRVLVWPALVQGERAAEQIVAGIEGFNRLPEGFPRPDVLIVARGGGSLEDLWCFNDEGVARAAAGSRIPLISAVGHETDTTLIDFASDVRAPTPTAAAEMAVPVRLDLLAEVEGRAAQLGTALSRTVERRDLALTAAGRGLGRPEALIQPAEQRLDRAAERLGGSLSVALERAENRFARASQRLRSAALGFADRAAVRAGRTTGRLSPTLLRQPLALRAQRLEARAERLSRAPLRGLDRASARLDRSRLPAAAVRRSLREGSADTAAAARRLAATTALLDRAGQRLEAQGRLLTSYSYQGVLERGFALVTAADGAVVRRASEAQGQVALRFADGVREAVIADGPKAKPKRAKEAAPQTSLFE